MCCLDPLKPPQISTNGTPAEYTASPAFEEAMQQGGEMAAIPAATMRLSPLGNLALNTNGLKPYQTERVFLSWISPIKLPTTLAVSKFRKATNSFWVIIGTIPVTAAWRKQPAGLVTCHVKT